MPSFPSNEFQWPYSHEDHQRGWFQSVCRCDWAGIVCGALTAARGLRSRLRCSLLPTDIITIVLCMNAPCWHKICCGAFRDHIDVRIDNGPIFRPLQPKTAFEGGEACLVLTRTHQRRDSVLISVRLAASAPPDTVISAAQLYAF